MLKTLIRLPIFTLSFLLAACGPPYAEKKALLNAYNKQHTPLTVSTIASGDASTPLQLSYVAAGAPDQPTVVFIHGTPGQWDAFSEYLIDPDLQQHARLVAVDRPGWGLSQLPGNRSEPSFARQTELLTPLLEQLHRQNNGRGIILLGHSLGASIAPRIALAHPDKITGLILLSGSLDPRLGKPRWYNRIAVAGPIAWLAGRDLRKANREIMALQGELKLIEQRWSELDMPITVIQGLKDSLVYPANADFAEQVLQHTRHRIILLKDANHFTPWNNYEDIKASLIDMLTRQSTGS